MLQLELTGAGGLERSRQAGVRLQEDASLLAAAFSWGLHDDLDLVVGLPLGLERRTAGVPGVPGERGGDVLLEAKWRFLEAGGFSLALKPGLSLPTGDATLGLGTGRPCVGAALLVTQLIGPVSLHLNAAFAHDEFARAEDRQGARADHWHASAAIVARGDAAGLQLVANLGAATSADRNDPTPPAFALGGLIYAVTGSLDLDCGVKVGLTNPEPGLVLLAGLAAHFVDLTAPAPGARL